MAFEVDRRVHYIFNSTAFLQNTVIFAKYCYYVFNMAAKTFRTLLSPNYVIIVFGP